MTKPDTTTIHELPAIDTICGDDLARVQGGRGGSLEKGERWLKGVEEGGRQPLERSGNND